MSPRRRFELVEGASSKFWEIELEGSSHTVRFGRIGTDGQTKTKTFASTEAAGADVTKLVREKLGKGYQEVGGATEPPTEPTSAGAKRYTLTTRAGHPPLVLRLAGNRLVTNDIAQLFPSADAAREHLERVIALRKKDGYSVSAAEDVPDDTADAPTADDNFKIKPHDGRRWTVTFKGTRTVSPSECDKVLARLERDIPLCVQLICDFASPGAHWAKQIADRNLPSVQALIFDTHFQTQTRQGRNSIGDLEATLRACSGLKQLFASGDLALEPGQHESLREAYFLGDPLTPAFLEALGAWRLPSLERLVLSLASDAGPSSGESVASALMSIRAPIHEVYLESVDDVPELLSTLASRGIPSTWKILSISGSVDEDQLLEVLSENASSLRGLEALGLPLSDELSSDAEAAARGLLPSVRDSADWKALSLPAVYEAWPS